MIIKNVRIEERLIHGQVVTVWLSELKVDRIIVIDDEASKNDMQKQMLKLACPTGIKLSIFGVDRAIERLSENPYDNESVFILFKNPDNLKRFVDQGYPIKEVNVGNMSGKDGATQVKKAVSVTHREALMFKEMNSNGIEFTAKMIPSDPNVDFMALIENV